MLSSDPGCDLGSKPTLRPWCGGEIEPISSAQERKTEQGKQEEPERWREKGTKAGGGGWGEGRSQGRPCPQHPGQPPTSRAVGSLAASPTLRRDSQAPTPCSAQATPAPRGLCRAGLRRAGVVRHEWCSSSFTEVHLTCHTTQPLKCTTHQFATDAQRCAATATVKLRTVSSPPTSTAPPQPPATTDGLSVAADSPVPAVSHAGNHSCVSSCLASVAQRVFQVHPGSPAKAAQYSAACMNRIPLLIRWRTLFSYVNDAAASIHAHVSMWMCTSISLGRHPGVEARGHALTVSLTFWGNTRPVSTAVAPFYTPAQQRQGLLSPRPHPHSLSLTLS